MKSNSIITLASIESSIVVFPGKSCCTKAKTVFLNKLARRISAELAIGGQEKLTKTNIR